MPDPDVDDELIRFAAQALMAAAAGDEAATRAALEHLDPDLASRVSSLLVELMHSERGNSLRSTENPRRV